MASKASKVTADFLSSPENLVFKDNSFGIIMILSKQSIDFLKKESKKN